jgi:hypothetical protein
LINYDAMNTTNNKQWPSTWNRLVFCLFHSQERQMYRLTDVTSACVLSCASKILFISYFHLS